MARTAILAIRIISDASGAGKGLDQASGSVGKFEAGMGKATAAAAGVVAGLTVIGKAAVKEASALQQNAGAVESVFGKQATAVMGLADAAAQSVGLAKSEYAGLAAVLGAQLTNLGVSQDKLVGTTDTLISTGADLAAMFGGTTQDAVEALTAAFRGETDPIEKYGISLKQADVNAELAAKGQDKLKGSAKKQAETQARLAIIMRQSAKAHGQFGREADTAAGQQQRAAAAAKNALADLGVVLLPIVSKAAALFAQLAGYVSQNATVFQILAGVAAGLAGAIMALNAALKIYSVVQTIIANKTKIMAAAQWLLNAAMTANPIGLIIAGIVLLVAGFVLLYKRSETFRKVVQLLWSALKTGLAVTIAWFKKLGSQVAAVMASIAAVVLRVANKIRSLFTAAFNAVKAVVSRVVSWIKAYIATQIAVATRVANAIRNVFTRAWSAIKSAAATMISAVKAIIGRVTGPATAAANKIRSAFVSAFDRLKSAASGLTHALTAPFRAIASAIQSAINAVQRLINAIRRIPAVRAPKIPKIGGQSAATASSGGQLYAGTRGVIPGQNASNTAAGGGITINVTGALDPEAVARQIERVLTGAQRRRSGVVLRQRAAGAAA